MSIEKITAFYRGDSDKRNTKVNTVQDAINYGWLDCDDEYEIITVVSTMCGNFSMSESFTGVDSIHIDEFLIENFQDDIDAGQIGFEQVSIDEYFNKYNEYQK